MGDQESNVKKFLKASELVLGMLLVQVIALGMQLLSRAALLQGTFIFALLAYRHVVAALCVAPLAFYLERGQEKKFGWSVWFWLFANALTGVIFAMGFFYYGLRDTTATYSANFLNLIPIVTFAFSLIARIETLKLHTRAGKVKIVGALLSLAGALTTSLYKGHEFHISHHHVASHATTMLSQAHWTRGTFLLIGSCISYASWFIVQVKLQKVFPLKYWSTMLTCIIASLQSVIIGACVDRSASAWRLRWDLPLLTIVYSGMLSTATTFCLLLRAISKQGPTYPSMFNPLSLIFVTFCEALLFGEAIRVGTLLGMVLIISGLYSFLWGKRKEPKTTAQQILSEELIGQQLTATVVPRGSSDRKNDMDTCIDVENRMVHKGITEES